jgi:hypothetical protein
MGRNAIRYPRFVRSGRQFALWATLVAGGGASPANANIVALYDNLGQPTVGIYAANIFGGVFTGIGPIDVSFDTGSAPVIVSDVGLVLADPTPGDGGIWGVTINAVPLSGNALLSQSLGPITGFFSDAILPTTPTAFDIPMNPVELAANTRYWLGLASTAFASWGFESGAAGVGVAGEDFTTPGIQADFIPDTNGAFQALVSGVVVQTVVPEPATWVMLLAVFAILGARKLKRRPLPAKARSMPGD